MNEVKIKNSNPSYKILVVDDDEGLRRLLQKNLRRLGYQSKGCSNGAEAIVLLQRNKYDLLLLDYKLPDMNAKEIVRQFQDKGHKIPFLIMSGQGNEKIAVDLMKLGARDYLVKEYRFPDLLPQVVKQTIEKINVEKKLAEMERSLASQEALYKTLIESVPHVIWLADAQGQVHFFNTAWYKMTDRNWEESLGDRWIDALHSSDKEQVLNNWKQAQKNAEQYESQHRLRTADNAYRTVEAICTPVIDKSGEVINWVGISTDITEHKRIEENLKQKTEDLRRSNVALEEFAYVASHDLQEPLRKVANFTELLATRYKGKLDSEANEFIDYIIDGATRMQGLIRDLLSYSRVGRAELRLETTNFEEVLSEVLANLDIAIKECNGEITAKQLPTVMTNRSQMTQLLQNLISNAIKYRGSHSPRVHISAKPRNGTWVFSVRDNGIGIDPQYQDLIFSIFQRLHTKDEYQGAGVGLAICKKIVERHGGRIWFESQPEEGTTFFFSLPIETHAKVAKNLGNKKSQLPPI